MAKKNFDRNRGYKNGSSKVSKNRDGVEATDSRASKRGSTMESRNANPRSEGPLVNKGKISPSMIDGKKQDWVWYLDKYKLVESAASIPTYLPAGKAYYPFSTNSQYKLGMPSALVIRYLPHPGSSSSSNSALSIAGQQIFQQIRKALNKPIQNYQFADPMIAYIVMCSAIILAEEMKREYGIMNSYSTANLAFPVGILKAFGYSEDSVTDFRNNMADYRRRYNILMNALSAIYMPIETNVSHRYRWMASNYWMDHDSPKAQVYAYLMGGYYTWEEDGENGSKAVFNDIDFSQQLGSSTLFSDKLDLLEQIITTLRNSDSFNYLMSDMERAFDGFETYKFEHLDEDYTCFPSYNDKILNQFQNNETLPALDFTDADATDTLSYTQNVMDNTIISMPEVPLKYQLNLSDVVALNSFRNTYGIWTNFLNQNPTTEDMIENTHGKMVWSTKGTDTKISITMGEGSHSTEIYIDYIMVAPYTNADGVSGYQPTQIYSLNNNPNYTDGDTINTMVILSKFDWIPSFHFKFKNGLSDDFNLMPFAEDDCSIMIPKVSLINLFNAEQQGIWKNEDIISTNNYR